jgi:hypothetical protein
MSFFAGGHQVDALQAAEEDRDQERERDIPVASREVVAVNADTYAGESAARAAQAHTYTTDITTRITSIIITA